MRWLNNPFMVQRPVYSEAVFELPQPMVIEAAPHNKGLYN
jgi:hypothetical protein